MHETLEADLIQHTRWLAGEWATSMAQAVESMARERPQVVLLPEAATANPLREIAETLADAAGEMLWQEQALDLARGASLRVGAPAGTWNAIGGRALAAAGVEAPTPADVRSTYDEILAQSFASLARALSGLTGREVACDPSGAGGAAAAVETAAVEFSLGAEKLAPFRVVPSAELLAALGTAAGTVRRPVSAQGMAAPANAPAETDSPSRAIDVLLDVELPVSISFGRTDLPLKDVLKLSTGSIVELNRAVGDAVEVIVNNCVVARGEVVVVEGNYGVRIQQIISRQERLRTLR